MVSFVGARRARKQFGLAMATLLVLASLVILILRPGFMRRVVQAQTPSSQRLLVRGYIAARPGQRQQRESEADQAVRQAPQQAERRQVSGVATHLAYFD